MSRLKQLGISEIFEHKVSFSQKHGDKFHFIKLNLEDKYNYPYSLKLISLIFTKEQVQAVENKLNDRRRKRFGFKTPNQVYLNKLTNQ